MKKTAWIAVADAGGARVRFSKNTIQQGGASFQQPQPGMYAIEHSIQTPQI